MAVSQNGWKVDQTGELQDRSTVHGVKVPNGVLRGDVATVLHHLMDRFHREVEELVPGWCWGWFVKNIEGSRSVSNHASGTAIDLNAERHPMGVRNTFTPAQRDRIHKILADLDGVVRWGGDYTGRPDDMHFEIDKSPAAVKAVADRIRAGGEGDMLVKKGDTGEEVKFWQHVLSDLGYASQVGAVDGVYGDKMEAAVNAHRTALGQNRISYVSGYHGFAMLRAMMDKRAGQDGPEGPTGPEGPRGPEGPAGPAGEPGQDGTLTGVLEIQGGTLSVVAR